MTPSVDIGVLTNLSLPSNSRGKRQSVTTTSLDDAETLRTAVRERGDPVTSGAWGSADFALLAQGGHVILDTDFRPKSIARERAPAGGWTLAMFRAA